MGPRPRAKDDLHARARELRERGLDYEEIAAALGVSKSSVSLWVRDIPRPFRLTYEESRGDWLKERGATGPRSAHFARPGVRRSALRRPPRSAR